MSKLRILHLSDLHFKDSNSTDQKIVLEALRSDLKADHTRGEKKIDLFLFSGDLVQAGKSELVFAAPYNNLVYPILKELDLSADRFFICPGNHDVDREVVRRQGYVESGLKATLTSRDSINAFIDQFLNIDLSKQPLPEPFQRLSPLLQYNMVEAG